MRRFVSRFVIMALLFAGCALAQVQLLRLEGDKAQPVTGPIQMGSTSPNGMLEARFRVVNSGTAPATLEILRIWGEGFGITPAPGLPLTLAAGTGFDFTVRFTAPEVRGYMGILNCNSEAILVQAEVEPAPQMPEFQIMPESPVVESGKQARVSIHLASPAPNDAHGILSLAFTPLSGPDDPAIQFPSGGRKLEFSVAQGETAARFGSADYALFQTGTTAGSLAFIAELAGRSERIELAIAGSSPVIIASRGTKTGSGIDLTLTGFDNTRSASRLTFTFFDSAGAALPPGTIEINAAEDFREFFKTSAAGGSFSLKARFPVAGDVSRIDAAEASIDNARGSAKTERIRF